jgi:cysteine synthase
MWPFTQRLGKVCSGPRNKNPPTYDIRRLPDSAADPAASVAAVPARCRELKHMIGNTPLLAIRFRFRGQERVVYAEAEHINMTGSIKDRMAFHILRKAYQEGKIQPGDTIAEATSGNTGIWFAAIGRALGHQVVIFMPDWMSQERGSLIKSLGANIVPVRRDQGSFLGSIRMTEELAEHKPHLGLAVGISSGANFIGALTTQNDLGADAVVTAVFPDDNKKYLSTDLLREERSQADYLTPEVELLSYHAFKRVCYTCFDGEE